MKKNLVIYIPAVLAVLAVKLFTAPQTASCSHGFWRRRQGGCKS